MEGRMQSVTNGVQKKATGEGTKRTANELYEMIEHSVGAGKIAEAEALREELMDNEAIPLSLIIAAAELIEDAKLAGIDDNHQLLWIDLYDSFTPEEKGLFYYSLEEKVVPAKTVILRQGQVNDSLYFVEEGNVDAIFTKEKENNLIVQIGKGGFLGEDSFFGMSVCTSSFVSRTLLTLKVLSRESTAGWSDLCPGLLEKVEGYCYKFGQYEELYERKRQEKSRFDRLTVHGQVFADLLTSAKQKSGKQFKAAVGDISQGGACFFIKASKKEVARTLLAKPLRMIFAIKANTKVRKIAAIGRVVRVKFHLENDYSVHVKFTKPLEQETLDGILVK